MSTDKNIFNAAMENNANENKNNFPTKSGKDKKSSHDKPNTKQNEIPILWKVLAKARPVFDVQLEKSNELKLKSIERFMPALYADRPRFWMDFMEQVNILLDSRKFCRECKAMGYLPENVAEHIVFLGSGLMRKVLKNGVRNTLGAVIMFYGERLAPDSAISYRDNLDEEEIKKQTVSDARNGEANNADAGAEQFGQMGTKPETVA